MAADLQKQPANDIETLTMSQEERARLTIMTGFTDWELTSGAEAAAQLGVS